MEFHVFVFVVVVGYGADVENDLYAEE